MPTVPTHLQTRSFRDSRVQRLVLKGTGRGWTRNSLEILRKPASLRGTRRALRRAGRAESESHRLAACLSSRPDRRAVGRGTRHRAGRRAAGRDGGLAWAFSLTCSAPPWTAGAAGRGIIQDELGHRKADYASRIYSHTGVGQVDRLRLQHGAVVNQDPPATGRTAGNRRAISNLG